MATSKNLNDLSDRERCEIVSQEIDRFMKLVKGHEKLLEAIGQL